MAEGEVEYESDPEEAKLSLKMRRREASDDEEEREKWGDRTEKPPLRINDLEEESEGAAAEYEEDVEEEDEDYYDEYVEEEELQCRESVSAETRDGGQASAVVAAGIAQAKTGVNEDGSLENNVSGAQVEEQKKELEPFSVPTSGAFYMHDDRFRDNARGRHRRMLGGRRLWESKDERKWGHDKFEELTSQERHHGEHRRGSRGRYRGRGRSQGTDHAYTQVNRPKESSSYGNPTNHNQGNASKGTWGRGPHKYQPSSKNYDGMRMTNKKLSEKHAEGGSRTSSMRTSENASNAEPEKMLPRKQVASNLNVASPPFYPTGSSTKDTSMTSRRDAESVSINGNDQQSVASKGFMAQPSGMMRGESTVDSINVDKLYLDDSSFGVAGRPPSSIHMPLYGSLPTNSHNQLRAQGRGVSSQVQPVLSGNQVNRSPSSSLLQGNQRNTSHNRSQPPLQSSVQKFPKHLPSGAQASSPSNASGNMNELEQEELDSAPETNLSKTELSIKGKEGMKGVTKGSFIYGGAKVIGASGSIGRGHNDQSFPAFLPVMQFGGQHPGGMGVPAVGMAFPGYVAQPQLGIGSSEMTWLPVIAGAAGALGAAYCPPYITVDGSYHSHASESQSSNSLSKENIGEKPSNEWMPAQNTEMLTEEVGQRRRNPRRYTEMKFDK